MHYETRDTSDHLDDDTVLQSKTWYKILECNGCKAISFTCEYIGEDDPDGTIISYPKRTKRKFPKYLNSLIWRTLNGKTDIYGLLKEIYNAYADESYRLVAMGIRSLTELIMIEQVGDHGSFKNNIDEFFKGRHINIAQREKLIHLIDIGSAVIHRAAKPDLDIIDEMLDVLENIVESIYVNKKVLQNAYDKFKHEKKSKDSNKKNDIKTIAQQGDAPEPATIDNSASQTSKPPAR
jgi:hypothetical protein